MKLFNLFKRKKTPVVEDLFKKKYQSFKKLLDANNDVLEIMSRLETVSEGDFVFDMQYIRARSDAILDKCKEIIDELNILGNDRYAALIPVYDALKTKIQQEVFGKSSPQSASVVLPLTQIDRGLLWEVGGKNANLGEIKNRVPLPTPDGFVLTAEAYRQVLAENSLTSRVAAFLAEVTPGNLEEIAEKSRLIREQILQASIPHHLTEEVNRHYHQLAQSLGYQPRLALRSSGFYEDQEHSFAGQFLTKLNVSFQQFFPNYLEILASQFSPAPLVYLAQKGLIQRELAMSVGCLAMVPARASGVLFTEDPTGSHPGAMVIEAAWGLGPTVVEGTLIPDRYLLAKKPEFSLLEQHISPKPFRLTSTATGEGLTEEVVPDSESHLSALTPEELLRLGRHALQLEEYFGEPQDIEFAVDTQGQVIILQVEKAETHGSIPASHRLKIRIIPK